MKTRLFDGKVYIKASELAREHRYTSDYIGQLARGHKIEARLAGKTWYVHEASLLAYIKRNYTAKPARAPRTQRKPALKISSADTPKEQVPTPKRKPRSPKKSAKQRVPEAALSHEAAPKEPMPTSTPIPTDTQTPNSIWQKATSWFTKRLRKD